MDAASWDDLAGRLYGLLIVLEDCWAVSGRSCLKSSPA